MQVDERYQVSWGRKKNNCTIEIKRKITIVCSKMKGDFFSPALGILDFKEQKRQWRWDKLRAPRGKSEQISWQLKKLEP